VRSKRGRIVKGSIGLHQVKVSKRDIF